MDRFEELEVPKYKTKKESNVSKANKKAKHKHLYEECFTSYTMDWLGSKSEHISLSSYCPICGKIGGVVKNSIVKNDSKVENNGKFYYHCYRSGKELYEEYGDRLPLFHINDFCDGFVDLNELDKEDN